MNNRPDEKVALFKGFSKMFSQLTSKQAYLGTASFAAIILAVGVTQNFDQIYPQSPLKGKPLLINQRLLLNLNKQVLSWLRQMSSMMLSLQLMPL